MNTLLRYSSILILILSVMLVECTDKIKVSKSITFIENQFAFLEFYQIYDGKVIKGTVPPGKRIDSPTYIFDQETRSLQIHRLNASIVLDSLQVLLGAGRVLEGSAGSGVSSVLMGVNSLPYKYANIQIIKFDPDKIYIKYKENSFVINVGKEWSSVQTKIDTFKNVDNAIVETIITTKIKYHGLLPKTIFKDYK